MSGPDDDGWFTTTLRLTPGRYEYKFVIDDKYWTYDPGNREQTGFYNNSILHVGRE